MGLFAVFLLMFCGYLIGAKFGAVNPIGLHILMRLKDMPANLKKMDFLDALFILFFGDKYKKNPKGSKLNDKEKKAILMGLVLAEQNGAFVDTFETGVFRGKYLTMLNEWYGIDSKQSAHDTMLRFLNEGHNVEYNFVKKYVVELGEEAFTKTAEAHDENRRYYEFFSNLRSATPVIVKNEIIKSKEDLLKIDAYAWDAGRIAVVARACVEMAYLTEKEAWDYILKAYDKSTFLYKSWEEFGRAYVVGRAMWGGNNGTLDGIISIYKEALSDENSPWKEVSFK